MRLRYLAILGFFVVGTIIGSAMVSIGYQTHEPRALPAPKVADGESPKPRTVDQQLVKLRELQLARLRALQKAAPPPGGAPDDEVPIEETPSTWRQAGGQTSEAPAASTPTVELVALPIDYSPADGLYAGICEWSDAVDRTTADSPECPDDEVEATADVPTVDDLVADAAGTQEQEVLKVAMEKAAHRVDDLPDYELLHANKDFKSDKVYAELLIPSLKDVAGHALREQIVHAIAEREGLDIVTVYCTLEARKAHYSMEYFDTHPRALETGYIGEYEKGRLWAYAPGD